MASRLDDRFLFGDPAQMLLSIQNASEIKALTTAQVVGGSGCGSVVASTNSPVAVAPPGFQKALNAAGEHGAHHRHHQQHGRSGAFDQADVVDAGVGGGIDLDHIEAVPAQSWCRARRCRRALGWALCCSGN